MATVVNKIFVFIIVSTLAFAQEYSKGLVFDDEEYDNTPTTAKLLSRDFEILPSSISLRAYAPMVGNQGKTGTCTAWATAYGARTILESIEKHRKNRVSTTQNVFSPSYIYNQIRYHRGCQEGTNIGHALKLIKREGVAKFNQFGFNCNKSVTQYDRKLASSYKIDGYKTLFRVGDRNKIQPVKKALSEYKPVIIGMNTPDSFSNARSAWRPRQHDYYGNFGGHAMVVVGYDDNKYGGSFQLMNSWGKQWGNNGFTWIRYSDFKHFVKYSYEMIPKPSVKKSIKLGGEIKFIDSNGKEMRATYNSIDKIYRMNQPYRSGTKFNFFMKNAQPAYLYAFGLDSVGKVSNIFPHNRKISAYLGYKNSTVAFPDENSYIRMDNHTGKDYFIILYSKKGLKNIDEIKRRFSSLSGSVKSRLDKVLRSYLIDENQIDFSTRKIKFNYNSNYLDSIIIAVIVEFEHI